MIIINISSSRVTVEGASNYCANNTVRNAASPTASSLESTLEQPEESLLPIYYYYKLNRTIAALSFPVVTLRWKGAAEQNRSPVVDRPYISLAGSCVVNFINSESISFSLQKSKAPTMAAPRRPSSGSSRANTYFTVLVSLLLLATIPTTAAAKKRLSRDDLAAAASPIKLAADAPLGDNIATASDSDAVSVPAPNASAASQEAAAASAVDNKEPATASDELDANFQSMMDDCDPDMIGFEIITG